MRDACGADAELPVAGAATAMRFTIRVEDGSEFSECPLASRKAEGKARKRQLTCCLRCEAVPTP